MELNFGTVEGLPEAELSQLRWLLYVYNYHKSKNRLKRRYYNGHISLGEVNLGIALPGNISKLSIGCSWGKKTVDVLASRSMFDGYVSQNGNEASTMRTIFARNRMKAEYQKACKEELKYGCTFAVVSGDTGNARVRFYSPLCAAALWDDYNGQIECGFAFRDMRKDESDINWSPNEVSFFTKTDTWELVRDGHWYATRYPNRFGRPLMVPLVWDATGDKPFGQSRIQKPIRGLIQGYVRTVANATIGLEFATSPQKYLLGVTDEQYDAIINNKFKQYVGSVIASTTNPETGTNPTFGQLSQGSIEPHVQMLRILATQFSAASGLTVTDTGVVNDANPTSSDAILAQSQSLVSLAQDLNDANGDALYQVAQLAQAIELGTTIDVLPDEDKSIVAHFKNPAMPSVSVTADAAIKIASAREGFAQTDTFLEMIGFDQADIRRVKAQETLVRGQRLLDNMNLNTETEGDSNADNGEGME